MLVRAAVFIGGMRSSISVTLLGIVEALSSSVAAQSGLHEPQQPPAILQRCRRRKERMLLAAVDLVGDVRPAPLRAARTSRSCPGFIATGTSPLPRRHGDRGRAGGLRPMRHLHTIAEVAEDVVGQRRLGPDVERLVDGFTSAELAPTSR